MTAAPSFTTPEWVKHAVFYQIFPERFANGDPSNDPENAMPWGTPPTITNFMGGDLQGILDHLDYLHDLGITALYLTPIFQATSNHKYNTFDYYQIDPHFGTHDTFKQLIDAAHEREIKVILDGVFNHTGRGFWAFNNILENGTDSPYFNWFHVNSFPLHAFDKEPAAGYQYWWEVRSLPKLNTDHPPVRQYLLDVARHWIEQGADGWRLDVPNEIADHDFWREFRHVVKVANPEAYIVGEIWEDGSPWLDGTQFDAVMNYLFRKLALDFFATHTLNAADFSRRVEQLMDVYHPQVVAAQLNLLGSHDTERFLSQADGQVERLKLAVLWQMTLPGAPCVYYGDEVGMTGGKDPLCRGAFPWDENAWNRELHQFYKQAIAMRHRYPVLRSGEYCSLNSDAAANVMAYARTSETSTAVIVLNNSAATIKLDSLDLTTLPVRDGMQFEDALAQTRHDVTDHTLQSLEIAPWSGLVLVTTDA